MKEFMELKVIFGIDFGKFLFIFVFIVMGFIVNVMKDKSVKIDVGVESFGGIGDVIGGIFGGGDKGGLGGGIGDVIGGLFGGGNSGLGGGIDFGGIFGGLFGGKK